MSPVSSRAGDDLRREAGLHPDQVGQGVQPRRIDRVLRGLAAEHPQQGLDQRRPDPAAARGAGDRRQPPLLVQGHQRRHHRAHPHPGLDQPADQLALADHRVQVDPVAVDPDPGAETQAGGDRTAVALVVDRHDVGGLGPQVRSAQRLDQAARRDRVGPWIAGHGAGGRGHSAEQVVEIVAARVHGETVHVDRAGRRLDHGVGVQIRLAEGAAIGHRADEGVGVRAG